MNYHLQNDDDEYNDDEEVYDNQEMDDDAFETANANVIQEDNESNVFTPGNAAQNFDKIQVNQNFQFPGNQNRLHPGPNQMIGGKMRPQSAKTTDDQQLKFQQQAYQNQQMNPAWAGNQMNGPNPPALIGGFTAPYGQGAFYQGVPPQGGQLLMKKRPTTASRRNQVQFTNNTNKQKFASKNPSTLDLEVSRLRPKIINQERERLYDDAMKQKITANFLKDENVKLKTKVHMLETELNKKERLVDDLLMQQDQIGQLAQQKGGMSKLKLEGHLSLNLKRKIREMQQVLVARSDEIEALKRNIKSTKIAEIEVEMKMYMDECTRLRHQLEEVIKSKDTFADPEEVKIIEQKFQQQDILIQQLKNENNELAIAFTKKDEENRQFRDLIGDFEKKHKKAQHAGKESSKLKKQVKEKERELTKLKTELQNQKVQNEDYRMKIEELVKKNQSNFHSRPQTAHQNNISSSNANNYGTNQTNDAETRKLRQDVMDKDSKIKELNGVVQQLQTKLQEKMNELSKEQFDKQKFKDLYEKYQEDLAKLQAQVEVGMPIQSQKQQESFHKEDKKPQQQQEQLKKQNTQKSEKFKETEKKIARVDPNTLTDVFVELKLKLQVKGFFSNQIQDFFFHPYNPEQQVTIKILKDVFECNGISEKKSELLARFIVEPKNQQEVVYNSENSTTQREVILILTEKIGYYKLYNDANFVKKLNDKIQKNLGKYKQTIKETVQLEDYEEEGLINYLAFNEAFSTLDLDVDDELMDYILYVVYQKSESLEKMKYLAFFDLLEGKIVQGQLSVGSEGQSRKRPESSSPEKLKARNKEKFTGNQDQSHDQKNQKKQQMATDEEEDNYEEEFEKLLDKDDEDNYDEIAGHKQQIKNLHNEDEQEGEEGQDGEEEDGEDYFDEEQMLDIAEKCFVKMAEAIIQRQTSVRQAFKDFIIKEDLEGEILELLSPIGFLEGIKELGITDLEEVEVACLMRVLTKADLENAILLKELIVIMENFGIQDDEDDQHENPIQTEDQEPVQEQQEQQQQPNQKKKKKKAQKQLDLSALDEKSIKILAKLMLALMELNVSLYDFFDGAIYEQQIKTKKKQSVVEIMSSKDFFEFLQKRGVRKSDKEHGVLKTFLSLNQQYPDLIMLSKIAKALDEMAKNEELMAGLLGAAEDGIDAAEGEVNDYNGDPAQQQQRLITIGEDGEDDNHYDTNKENSRGNASKKQTNNGKLQKTEEEYDEDYEQNNQFEEDDDDYQF